MFYSHEILSNSQYGVATIWLVATVGKANSRKVTRKAIQEVNVPKACETIIEPGAPLALRLQGNLLYGTARVFAQQCGYVLADAEKTQSDMMTFFRIVQTSEIDLAAGKTKRQNIVLPDDPDFDPFAAMPSLDLLNTTTELLFNYSQGSGTKYSQFSPPNLSQGDSTPRSRASIGAIDLPSSSHSVGTYRLPSDLGHKDSPLAHLGSDFDPMSDFNIFQDGQGEAVPIALRFDEFGNLVGIDENEPDLPRIPSTCPSRPPTAEGNKQATNDQETDMPLAGDEMMLLVEEPPLPDAEAFGRPSLVPSSGPVTTDSVETGRATAKHKRANHRKAKTAIVLDEVDRVSRDDFRSWSRDYVEHMRAVRMQQQTTTLAKARKNALAFVSGNGVADVGNPKAFGGIVHPLASYFAGGALEYLLQGREPVFEQENGHRGRSRAFHEAFENENGEGARRVKQKTGLDDENGRGLRAEDGDAMMLEDDSIPEVGMEPMSAMAERHSSTVMPWSRPGSTVPGSSVRGHGSAQKLAPSPLLGRGRLTSDIDRQSDSVVPPSDDLDQDHLMVRSSSPGLSAEFLDGVETDTVIGGPAILDAVSQDFLGYITNRIKEASPCNSRAAQVGKHEKQWVGFHQLACPETHSKAVAAQAFLHVLSLATKNIIAVEQDGAADFIPFGEIRVGVQVKLNNDAREMASIGAS